ATVLDVRDGVEAVERRVAQAAEQARHGRRRGLAPDGEHPEGDPGRQEEEEQGQEGLAEPCRSRKRATFASTTSSPGRRTRRSSSSSAAASSDGTTSGSSTTASASASGSSRSTRAATAPPTTRASSTRSRRGPTTAPHYSTPSGSTASTCTARRWAG